MSSDRRSSDIYARGKHYDPNCQYRYMCQVYIAERYAETALVADKEGSPAGIPAAQEKGSGGLRMRTRRREEIVIAGHDGREAFFPRSYAAQTSVPEITR